jgi:hypothetical protein
MLNNFSDIFTEAGFSKLNPALASRETAETDGGEVIIGEERMASQLNHRPRHWPKLLGSAGHTPEKPGRMENGPPVIHTRLDCGEPGGEGGFIRMEAICSIPTPLRISQLEACRLDSKQFIGSSGLQKLIREVC